MYMDGLVVRVIQMAVFFLLMSKHSHDFTIAPMARVLLHLRFPDDILLVDTHSNRYEYNMLAPYYTNHAFIIYD